MTERLDSDGLPFVPLPTIMRYQVRRFRHDPTRTWYERWWGQEPVDFEIVHPGIRRFATRAAETRREERVGRLRARFCRGLTGFPRRVPLRDLQPE